MEEKNHWIIRVGNGINFKNSKYPFWGIKRGKNNCIKSFISKINTGDILWFLTSKSYNNIIIGMAEFTHFYDRLDEPLLSINTISNQEQGWNSDTPWDLQLHYINLYNTERQQIKISISCGATILNYNTFKDRIEQDLLLHYNNFIFYAEPIL